jgi:hypothetical protein
MTVKKKASARKRAETSKPAEADPGIWDLRLYVAGQTIRSLTAFENLKRICEEHLAGKYRIEGRYRPWSASSPSRCERSSATFPTPSGY